MLRNELLPQVQLFGADTRVRLERKEGRQVIKGRELEVLSILTLSLR